MHFDWGTAIVSAAIAIITGITIAYVNEHSTKK
jgi:hypothetical protein